MAEGRVREGGVCTRDRSLCVRGEETSPARSSNVRGMSDA